MQTLLTRSEIDRQTDRRCEANRRYFQSRMLNEINSFPFVILIPCFCLPRIWTLDVLQVS
jgi:hypothetical protein